MGKHHGTLSLPCVEQRRSCPRVGGRALGRRVNAFVTEPGLGRGVCVGEDASLSGPASLPATPGAEGALAGRLQSPARRRP